MKKSNKVFIGIVGAIIAVGFVLGIFYFLRGVQDSEKISDIAPDIAVHIKSKSDLIAVSSPKPLSVISSPLVVRGEARGLWYFEANFQLTLVDWDGRIISESFATAQGEWMTGGFVPFEGRIDFKNPAFLEVDQDHFSRRGTLIFQKANPSGLPEHADTLEIPILFEESNLNL